LDGVVRTRVGYAGGTSREPTYQTIGDHTETFQIDFDPEMISYDELLDIFWASHDPRRSAWSSQYKAAVFVHDEVQRAAAERSRERVHSALGTPVRTEILPAGPFYLAEGYHQKYRLQGVRGLAAEFAEMYPRMRDFVDSTAAARVNGYLDGYGNLEMVDKDLDKLGLTPTGAALLRTKVESRRR
jgi:methionine-S-sulfoxide reductase